MFYIIRKLYVFVANTIITKSLLGLNKLEINMPENIIKGEVEFKNFHFAYDNNIEVLTDINMNIQKGSTVAFIGDTGAGKTTLASLITGLYPPNKDKGILNIDKIKIGFTICYDLRFPEMARSLATAGAEVLVAPSAWVKGNMKEEHWITINKTRAIENGCYVIAPAQVGNIYCGRSLVVDPYRKVLLDMKKKQGINFVDIDLKKVKEIRKVLPLLKNRRADTYSTLKV